MEFALGVVGLGIVIAAIVWAMSLTRKVRKAGANYAPVRQETPGQRLAWCAVIIIGLTGVALLTVLSPIFIAQGSAYSAIHTAVTGELHNIGDSASAGQWAFALAQSFGVIVLAGVLSWLVVRRGQRIASTAIAAHKGALTR